jgi:SAM-dependent methyltransferase
MAAVEGVTRACPQCGSEAFDALPDYSLPPWQIGECGDCGFVFLRNPPEYKHFVSEFAGEKTRVAEVERRKARSLFRICAIHAPGVDGVKEFPDHYFTGILLRSFLRHEKQPKELLEQCSRVLAPGGAVHVRVPNDGTLNRGMLGAKWCGFRYPDQVNYFTTKSFGTMAGDCGLKLRLLNPLRLPLDDHLNAVLQRRDERAAIA